MWGKGRASCLPGFDVNYVTKTRANLSIYSRKPWSIKIFVKLDFFTNVLVFWLYYSESISWLHQAIAKMWIFNWWWRLKNNFAIVIPRFSTTYVYVAQFAWVLMTKWKIYRRPWTLVFFRRLFGLFLRVSKTDKIMHNQRKMSIYSRFSSNLDF